MRVWALVLLAMGLSLAVLVSCLGSRQREIWTSSEPTADESGEATDIANRKQAPATTVAGASVTATQPTAWECVGIAADRAGSPPEVNAEFLALLGEIPPGTLVIHADGEGNRLGYLNMEAQQAGGLLSVDTEDPLGDHMTWTWWRQPATPIIGWLNNRAERYAFDLHTGNVVRIGRICNEAHVPLSPSGAKLAAICDQAGRAAAQATQIEVDLLDAPQRTRIQLPVPQDWFGGRSLRWLSDNRLAFLAGQDGMACVLDLEPFGFGCLRDAKPGNDLEAFDDGTRIVVWSHPAGGGDPEECAAEIASCQETWRIYDAGCIREGKACTPELEVATDYTMRSAHPIPSPNGEVIAFVRGFPDSSDVGIVNVRDGAVTHLGTLGGYFGFVDWCPDSTCFLVAPGGNHPYARSYFIYLDGHQEPLDIADPMAILEIP